ncbi:MAG: hypothetical protein HZA36_03430 [Parcubacteria group bacterium]|nr:hypothetical protein [Parcubacteria group bacterium]
MAYGEWAEAYRALGEVNRQERLREEIREIDRQFYRRQAANATDWQTREFYEGLSGDYDTSQYEESGQ